MSEEFISRLQVYKPHSEMKEQLVRCDVEDKEASHFEIEYVNCVYMGDTFNCKNLHDAQKIQRMLARVYKAGKEAAKAELFAWMQPARRF